MEPAEPRRHQRRVRIHWPNAHVRISSTDLFRTGKDRDGRFTTANDRASRVSCSRHFRATSSGASRRGCRVHGFRFSVATPPPASCPESSRKFGRRKDECRFRNRTPALIPFLAKRAAAARSPATLRVTGARKRARLLDCASVLALSRRRGISQHPDLEFHPPPLSFFLFSPGIALKLRRNEPILEIAG